MASTTCIVHWDGLAFVFGLFAGCVCERGLGVTKNEEKGLSRIRMGGQLQMCKD